jgi:hypothetical protein
MSVVAHHVLVRSSSEPETPERAAVVALDGDGAIVGRASLSRLYGMRAEIDLELAPTTTVALALIDAVERGARTRGLVHVELDTVALSDSLVGAVRRRRPVADEIRGSHLFLTWPTTLVNS